MMTLEQILVATDFSEPSEAALLYGRELAMRFGARLHVLHVAQDVYVAMSGAENYSGERARYPAGNRRCGAPPPRRDRRREWPRRAGNDYRRSDGRLARSRDCRLREGEQHRPDRHGHARPWCGAASRAGERCGAGGPFRPLPGPDGETPRARVRPSRCARSCRTRLKGWRAGRGQFRVAGNSFALAGDRMGSRLGRTKRHRHGVEA